MKSLFDLSRFGFERGDDSHITPKVMRGSSPKILFSTIDGDDGVITKKVMTPKSPGDDPLIIMSDEGVPT
jgi:hypothetical protein